MTSATVGEVVEIDSAVDEAACVVDWALLTSNVVDASATDVGSNVVKSVAADEMPDIVGPAVVISTDADALADSVVSTSVTCVTADVSTDEPGVDTVTSGKTELPVETLVDSVAVTLSVDILLAVDSVVVESIASDVPDWVVISKVVLSTVYVVISATVDNEAVVSGDLTEGPGKQYKSRAFIPPW